MASTGELIVKLYLPTDAHALLRYRNERLRSHEYGYRHIALPEDIMPMFAALYQHSVFIALACLLLLLSASSLSGVASVLNDDPNVEITDGIAVYFGVIPAAVVRGHPRSHVERTMHGGPPQNASERHVVIALFDAKTFERIINAEVIATIEGLGHVGRTTKKLERMDIANAPTFGGYLVFQGIDKFTIRVEIKLPNRTKPTVVKFDYKT